MIAAGDFAFDFLLRRERSCRMQEQPIVSEIVLDIGAADKYLTE